MPPAPEPVIVESPVQVAEPCRQRTALEEKAEQMRRSSIARRRKDRDTKRSKN